MKMAPSEVECVPELSCCVCFKEMDTIRALHFHQMGSHTTEELSLALLTIKGLEKIVENGLKDSDSSKNRNRLDTFPQFLIRRITQREGDNELTVTAESSMLVGAITTQNGSVANCNQISKAKADEVTDSNTSISFETSDSESEIADEKLKPEKKFIKQQEKLNFKSPNVEMKTSKDIFIQTYLREKLQTTQTLHCENNVDAISKQHRDNIIVLCASDKPQISSELDRNDSETDTDVELKERDVIDLNGDIKSEDNEIYSSTHLSIHGTKSKLPRNDGECSNNTVSQIVREKDANIVNNISRNIYENTSKNNTIETNITNITLFDGIEMECTEEPKENCKLLIQNKHIASDITSPIKDELNHVSSYSPGMTLSPSNSPHPERHIQAIISRLPSIVLPEFSTHWEKKRHHCPVQESFVIPSPVTHYHRCNVLYDYGQINSISDHEGTEKTDELFQEYFTPRIQLGQLRDQIDASCGTEVLQHTEKEIQTNTTINDQDQQSRSQIHLKGVKVNNSEKNVQIKNGNAIKKPEVRHISSSVRRLALFRKIKVSQKNSIHGGGGSRRSGSRLSENSVSMRGVAAISSKGRENTAGSSKSFLNAGTSNKYHLSNAKNDRERIIRIYPTGITDRRFFCGPCGKSYKKKSHLERHLRVHTGERPFPCSFCEKRFAVRSILKQHIRIHTGEKPYSCSVCLQRFPQKSGLMTHMMLHTGKPFKCDLCEKSFVSNHKLLQHLRCHDSQSSHTCHVCDMIFFSEGALTEHAKFHAHKKSYVCMMCGASFAQEMFLKFHLDQHLETPTHTTEGT